MSDLTHTSILAGFPVAQSQTSWNFSACKRAFDIAVAASALIFMLPGIVIISVLVPLTSRGPIIFRQSRIGQGSRRFTLFKFRSMAVRSEHDSCLTSDGDRRVTPFGRFLRKTKLDELPQLYNVLRGDMSIVGPRPDMPEYAATLPAELRDVLLLKPGVTGAASIRFRNEEQLLARIPSSQLQSFYCNTLLPQKAALDLDYARRATFLRDFKTIVRTISVLLSTTQDTN